MNIQHIAEEYEKLIGNKYIIGIENGETICLSFTANDFYHLMGFKKFKDASIVRMIEDSAYNKRQFFKDVLNGNITFYKTDIHAKNKEKYYVNGQWKELCEVEVNDNVSLVLNNRMPYFSYNNINLLIKGELVALFDKSKVPEWRKIEADKIFFRFLEEKNRNLNFFIRKREDAAGDCPVSFFLEAVKDEYLRVQTGRGELIQKTVQITYRAIYENGTRMREFSILWDKIRFYYSKNNLEELFKSQKGLQHFFKSGTVISYSLVEQFLDVKTEELNRVIDELNTTEANYQFKLKVDSYNESLDNDKKDILAVEIVEEYGIDIEKEPVEVTQAEMKLLQKNLVVLKERITVLRKQIKKCNRFMPLLQQLEQEEVIYAYSEFIPEIKSYEREFIAYLISDMKVREMNIAPKEIKQIYKSYKNKKVEE